MLKLLKPSLALVCISVSLSALAIPPVKKAAPKPRSHGKLMPARHNAGRPMHG